MGFKVGSNWLYAPIFFLNGDLKGHELLYLKNQDMFVPLKEDWLNYILNRKPNILGEAAEPGYQRGILSPDLSQMSQSPSKVASVTWDQALKEVLPALAAAATYNIKKAMVDLSDEFDLLKFLKQASPRTLNVFLSTCRECPQLTSEIEKFYDTAAIIAAVKEAKVTHRIKSAGTILDEPRVRPAIRTGCILDDRPAHPIKTGKLKVIAPGLTVQTELPEGMDEEDQEKLRRDRVLIKDDRDDDEVSIPYHVRVEQKLTNPTETGLYQVLMKTGEFEKCLVVLGPSGPAKRERFCTVVRIDGEKNWCNLPPNQVWIGAQIDDPEFREWWEGLDAKKSLDKGLSRYIAISPAKDATCPFRVDKVYGEEGNKSKVYEVDFSDSNSGVGLMTFEKNEREELDPLGYSKWSDGQRLHIDAKDGTQIRVNRGDVFLPVGTKIIEVQHDACDDMTDAEREDYYRKPCNPGSSSETSPVRPGNILDAELQIMKKTSALSIYHDGIEVELNQQRMSPLQSLVTLISEHGFREPVARELLKQAQVKRKLTIRVKYASPYLTDSPVNAPGIPSPTQGGGEFLGYNGPSHQSDDQRMPVDRPPTDPQVYNPNTTLDHREVGKIRRAANTGQKEIFDTAMVGSMLKAVRDDTMVDKYLGPVTKGMDSLCRILFMFYWHGDEFADRYGKADMPELEDSLRNAIESVGDVLMFLKQKTIEPYPEENDVSTDLGAVANS